MRMHFPVVIEVPTACGRLRELRGRTVLASCAGATLELDETIPIGMGVMVSPPFGGALLAEVTGTLVDQATGRHRISISLIDPVTWTSSERPHISDFLSVGSQLVKLDYKVRQMLNDQAVLASETSRSKQCMDEAAEKILKRSFLADGRFQNWLMSRISEIQKYQHVTRMEEPEGPGGREQMLFVINNTTEQVFDQHRTQ